MIRKLKYVLAGFLLIILPGIYAQNSNVMYYMNLPQAHLLNPSLRPSSSVYVGLPALTGINLNLNNNFIGFSDVFMKGASSDSVITFLHPDYNVDDFINKLKKINYFSPEVNVQLFGLGFAAGHDSYIFFDIIDRVEASFSLPGDLLKLGLKGNEQFLGQKIDLSGLEAGAKYYREYGLGFSKSVNSRLRVGAKAKMLFGIATAALNNKELSITLNDDYKHSISADMAMNISGPVEVTLNADNTVKDIAYLEPDKVDFLLNSSNMGLGIDLGAVYDVSSKLSVSASLVDFGYIKWKSDVVNLTVSGQYEFTGFNVDSIANSTNVIDGIAEDIVNSLEDAFKINENHTPFTTYLPAGINLGASYDLTKNINVGFLSHSIFTAGRLRQSVTLSANANLGNILSTSFSYTAANHSYNNLGLGFALRLGIVQFYTVADKIPIMFNRIKINNSNTILLPDSWNTVNFRIGMNLVFGNSVKKKSDKPMMLEPQIIEE